MIYEYLKNIAAKNKLCSSYLIESDNINESLVQLKKFIFELLAAKADLDNNPDFMLVKCEGETNAKNIQIAQIRLLQNFLYKTTSISEAKVAIVFEAERMNINSANSMLKVLEDTPKNSYIFLLATNIATILPTIRSRCVLINSKRSAENSLIKTDINYDKYIEILEDQFSFAKKEQIIKEFGEKNRASWPDFADAMLLFISKIIKEQAGIDMSLSSLEKKIIKQLPRKDLDFLLSKYDQIDQLVKNTKAFDLEIKASTILLTELLYQNNV